MFKKLIDLFTDFKLTRLLLAMRYHGYIKEVGWFNSFLLGMPVDEDSEPLPWVTYSFIEFCKKQLKPDMTIFEFGTGNSSRFYSHYVKNIISVEHNSEWFNIVSKWNIPNCKILYKELEYGGNYSSILDEVNQQFDMIIVDGRDRVNCMKHAYNYLKPDGILVLDDAERENYKPGIEFIESKGYKSIEFWGFAPNYFHNKCTRIFFNPNESGVFK